MNLVDEIVSIEEVECDSLRYDITVADNHNFFANGVLVHNCQNLTNEWDELRQHTYEVTEKLEGSSMTVGLVDNEFIVCSRNLNLKETVGNTLWDLAHHYNIEQKMKNISLDNIVFQGEIIGEGVQGNHYGIKGQDFYVFAMYDIRTALYISSEQRIILCEGLGLKHVPIIGKINFSEIDDWTIDKVLTLADGNSQLNPAKLREGIVFKRIGGQEHFKAVSNEYLLRHG